MSGLDLGCVLPFGAPIILPCFYHSGGSVALCTLPHTGSPIPIDLYHLTLEVVLKSLLEYFHSAFVQVV